MKTVFLAPRAVVDLLAGRCVHHWVQTDSGDCLVVAEIEDAELREQVLAQPDLTELPHPHSSAELPAQALGKLAAAGVRAGDRTRDVVEKTIARHGMPALRHLLDR